MLTGDKNEAISESGLIHTIHYAGLEPMIIAYPPLPFVLGYWKHVATSEMLNTQLGIFAGMTSQCNCHASSHPFTLSDLTYISTLLSQPLSLLYNYLN